MVVTQQRGEHRADVVPASSTNSVRVLPSTAAALSIRFRVTTGMRIVMVASALRRSAKGAISHSSGVAISVVDRRLATRSFCKLTPLANSAELDPWPILLEAPELPSV